MNFKDAVEILNIAFTGRMDKDGYPDFDDIHNALYLIKIMEKEYQDLKIQLDHMLKLNSKIIKNEWNLQEKIRTFIEEIEKGDKTYYQFSDIYAKLVELKIIE